jgi:potassium-transporting ATPase KdpC subunit
MNDLLTSLRLAILTIVVCCIVYPTAMLAFGRIAVPWKAGGSMITGGGGRIVGSALIAQEFTRPGYFWPRPSAVGYNAAATGGSNLSPTSPAIAERAEAILEALGATEENPAPAELVLASGSGMDPHITLRGALYQVDRVARARGIEAGSVRAAVEGVAERAWPGEDGGRLVNVLRLNLELDRRFPSTPGLARRP